MIKATAVITSGLLLGLLTACGGGGASGTQESSDSSALSSSSQDASVSSSSSSTVATVVNFNGDLTFEADQNVSLPTDYVYNIAGDMTVLGILDALNSGNITINAQGDIRVDGQILIAAAEAGKGGTITLVSAAGNIILGGTLRSGDGSSGTEQTLGAAAARENTALARGYDGGDIILKAPAGTVEFGAAALLHLGSGGDGKNITVPEAALDTVTLESDVNAGGNSGAMVVSAANVNGVECDAMYENNETFTYAGVTYAAGDAFCITASLTFAGGTGGNAGHLYFGTDTNETNQSASNYQATYARFAISNNDAYHFHGSKGGNGWLQGGNGGNAFGKSLTPNEGTGFNALDVFSTGGRGGHCTLGGIAAFLCIPGNGGAAYARAGNGGSGAAPAGNGGNGGNAEAEGGLGGRNSVAHTEGKPGVALAVGGNGGNGGSGCPDAPATSGGGGGNGGDAQAVVYGPSASALAFGGNGGNGGAGESRSGGAGTGGEADSFYFSNDGSSFTIDRHEGKDGETSGTCPADVTSTCSCADATVSILKSEWDDCATTAGCLSTLHSLGLSEVTVGQTYTEAYGDGSGCSFKVTSCN